MNTTRPKCAIVGGRHSGTITAIALWREGLDVAVYEQASRLAEVGAGVLLTPNGVRSPISIAPPTPNA